MIQSPLTTLSQETRWAYSTMAPSTIRSAPEAILKLICFQFMPKTVTKNSYNATKNSYNAADAYLVRHVFLHGVVTVTDV